MREISDKRCSCAVIGDAMRCPRAEGVHHRRSLHHVGRAHHVPQGTHHSKKEELFRVLLFLVPEVRGWENIPTLIKYDSFTKTRFKVFSVCRGVSRENRRRFFVISHHIYRVLHQMFHLSEILKWHYLLLFANQHYFSRYISQS